jgi:peptidoglycan/xylan/chitin deacetylase (PgdA/CDA1 family)
MPARVIFTMDNLGDAADLYRGNISEPRQPGANPAFDRGYPALLELYARNGIPITYFVEGWSARQYPREIERILSHPGNEIGMHGWTHERWAELHDDEITALTIRATETIAEVSGQRPEIFRAPGGASTTHTRQLLQDLGYLIDASLTDRGAIAVNAQGFACLPYQWVGVDATHWLWNQRPCDEVEDIWKRALLDAARKDEHIVFIWHPHVMGINPEALALGEKFINYVQSDPQQFRIMTLRQLREHSLATQQAESLP